MVLSLRREAAKNWAEITKDSYGQHLESSVTIRILSLVGPVLSIEQDDGCDCGGAHPSATARFRAIDLTRSRPDKAAAFLLLDAVAEPDLLAALKADKLVKQARSSRSKLEMKIAATRSARMRLVVSHSSTPRRRMPPFV